MINDHRDDLHEDDHLDDEMMISMTMMIKRTRKLCVMKMLMTFTNRM